MINKSEVISACQTSFSENSTESNSDQNFIDTLLGQFESGEADFWTDIHQPFKANHLTQKTVRTIIMAAKRRYQTNLPGLAIKLRACQDRSNLETDERKKFLSFKNFLYKTIKISAS